MNKTVILSLLLFAVLGCYRQTGQDEGEGHDGTDSSTQSAAGDSSDIGDTEGQEYDQGVYHCCAKGEGTSCCDGYEQGMCFEYGGVYGECVPPGAEYEAKVICAHCCAGLDMVEAMIVTDEDWSEAGYPPGCGPSDAPPSLVLCVDCGDGQCGAGENRCICPEDCPG
jgi:hypothetical protein